MRILVPSAAFALLSIALVAPAIAADPYPGKPIHVIVPYAPGGVVDVQTRAVTQRLSAELGQPIVVETKPGAGGNIAADFVARSPADGYTLLVSAPYLINNPLIETSLRWAPKDFAPVARFTLSPSYIVVPAASPAKSVKEFVAMARQATPPLLYGESGPGSTQSMANEALKQAAGIEMVAVVYKGAPPLVPDLISNRFSMTILPSSLAYPLIKAGQIRALANISSTRSAQLPDVPTIAEAGYPDVTALSWYGFHVPAATPPDVIRRLEQAVKAATATQEVKERLANAGGEEAFLGTAEFSTFMATDGKRWSRVVAAMKK